jgi:hypothetical protein
MCIIRLIVDHDIKCKVIVQQIPTLTFTHNFSYSHFKLN